MLDRLDLLVPLSPSTPETLAQSEAGESSQAVKARVAAARDRQASRLTDTDASCNAEIPAHAGALDRFAPLTSQAQTLLTQLSHTRRLSPRAQHRLRRVALTITDLDHPEADPATPITAEALAQAAQLRSPPARE